MIKFGTSGFRGIMADNFTKENVQKIAYALCEISKEDNIKKPTVVVGFDNRFMSYEFAKWTSEVLAKKMNVSFHTKPIPTPQVSFETKNKDFGIAITASHNPHEYNGIKIFLREGKECDDVFAGRIEKIANKAKTKDIETIDFETAVSTNKVILTDDIKNYCDDMLKYINIKKIQKNNLKVLVNCMHGCAGESINYLFKKLKLNYETMRSNQDPYFGGMLPAPYKHNLTEQIKKIKDEHFDLGFAFDNDCDRFCLISSSGKYYDCNFAGSVIYFYLFKTKKLKINVVKSLTTSSLINKLAETFSLKCVETKIGFKYIAKELLSNEKNYIGIESEGFAYKPHTIIKDGIMTGLLVLDALCELGKSFDEIIQDLQLGLNFKSEIIEYAYPITDSQKNKIIEKLFVQKKIPTLKGKKITKTDYTEGLKVYYDENYFALFRFSGNEPVIRIYTEMKDLKDCENVISQLEKFIGVKEKQK